MVVWIHGGGWSSGSKENCPAVPLTAKGYAVASINYRLSQHAVFPAQIEDCKAAIRWLRANAAKYHLDPEHIGVWGASAGGHLVALLGTDRGGSRSSRAMAAISTSPAAYSASSTASAPRTSPRWAPWATSRAPTRPS